MYLTFINVSFSQPEPVRNVLVILSSDASPYRLFAETLVQNTKKALSSEVEIRTIKLRDLNSQSARDFFKRADIIVTAGDISTSYTTVENPKAKHIATLITLDSLYKVDSRRNNSDKIDCALVINQPFGRQLKIINRILPNVKSIGILTGSHSSQQIAEIRKAASNYHISLHTEKASGNIHGAIKNLARQGVDGILAIPDPEVYNSNSARNILISSYHYNIPIFGYSGSFVNAGALLGIYSTPEALASQLARIITRPGNCQTEKIIYPAQYTVEVNPQVARSLNITLETTELRTTYSDSASHE
jgi:hypothetical protein